MNNANNSHRWQTADGARLGEEVFRRLSANMALHDLGLGEYNGLIDLRGICAPAVRKEKLPAFRRWSLEKLSDRLIFRNVHFDGIDFSQSQLKHMGFFNSTISQCRFDGADCENWGLFATDISNSAFVQANLREAVLGPWYQGRGNTYRLVSFSRTDMRGVVSNTSTFIECDFSNARLEKLDFQSSGFIRCRFAGELREVVFWDHGFKTGKLDPNPMEDVDFAQAKLRWVEFRRLNLDRVRLPDDDSHLVLKNYRCVLQKALEAATSSGHQSAQGVGAVLRNRLKWVGPEQQVGVFNRLDFREVGGVEEEEFVTQILRRAELECARLQ